MKTISKTIAVLALVAGVSVPRPAAAEDMTDGFYDGAASYSIGATKKVTLDEDGYAVLKVSLNKGSEYTFVTEAAGDDDTVSVDIDFTYTEDGDKNSDTLASGEPDSWSTTTERCIVYNEDWYTAWIIPDPEEEDPEVYKPTGYYVVLSGSEGQTVTLTSSNGANPETTPPGATKLSAVSLGTISVTGVTKSGTIGADWDGCYWFKADLEKGRCYLFETTGSKEEGVEDKNGNSPKVVYPIASTNQPNHVFKVYSEAKGTYYIALYAENGTEVSVKARLLPARPIGDHPATALESGEGVECLAGARNDSGDKFADDIIDTSLFKVTLKAGETALFESSFETADPVCQMEFYDSTGECLAKNVIKHPGNPGQRLSYVAPKAGTYYVGVCQRDLDLDLIEERPEPLSGTILYTNLGVCAPEPDDDPSGAMTVNFVLGDWETEGAKQPKPNGDDRAFTATKTVDWLVMGARKNIEYCFKVVSAPGYYTSERPMRMTVWKEGKKGLELVEDLGDPEQGKGVVFESKSNATYYLKLEIPDGAGCDYPYGLFAWVDGEDYGFLKVVVHGPAGAKWNLKGETDKYVSGSEIMLKAQDYTVQVASAKGWTKPADQKVTVVPGNDDRTCLDVWCSDTSDHGDDTLAKAVSITPKNAGIVLERSLWPKGSDGKNDPADWFKFSVKADTVYEITLAPSEGNPVATVYRGGAEKDANIVAKGDVFSFRAFESGTYHLVVKRSPEAESVPCAYALKVRSVNVGQIKADKSEYKVGEKAGYLTVKFSRTGKEGRVRMRYTTVEGTAKANVHYVAQTGVLTWENGKNAAQAVKIKLIPDLFDKWDENREFSIRLDAVDDADFDPSSEYRPTFAKTELPVTVTDASKAAPGTLQFAGYGDEIESFANVKKPAVTLAAGDPLTLWVAREAGGDKTVGAKVTVTAKQASGEEFVVTDDQEIWWEDGDVETKGVVIQTMRPTDGYFAAKTFTVKLAALAGEAKAKVAVASVAVTLRDGTCARELADYTGSFDKASGVTAKASAGTWYFDEDDVLRSTVPAAKGKATFTWTVTGPGRLTLAPEVVDGSGATVSCKIGKSKKTYACDGSTICEYLGAGKTTVEVGIVRAANAGASAETFLRFNPTDNGDPMKWESLPAPTLVAPFLQDKQLMLPGRIDLKWSEPVGEEVFLFHCDKDKKKLGTTAAALSSLKNDKVCTEEFAISPYSKSSAFSVCDICGCSFEFEPNATYYWRVDSAFAVDGEVVFVNTNKSVWAFRTTAKDASCPYPREGFVDVTGEDVDALIAAGEPVEIVQGVSVTNVVFGSETAGVTYQTVSGSKLPSGVKLDKRGFLTGAAQKTGDYKLAVQTVSGNKVGATVGLTLRVVPLQLAAGSYFGFISTDEPDLTEDPSLMGRQLGSVSVTVKESGAISATVKTGTTSSTFKAPYYDATVDALENGEPGVCVTMKSVAKLKTKDGVSHTVTNALKMTVCRGATDDLGSLDTPAKAEFHLAALSADGKKVVEADYAGEAVRDNTKLKDVVAAEKPFQGYHVISMPVVESFDGAPQGSGYLTVTVDAKGKAKYSGKLGDGTAVSGSGVPAYVSDNGNGAGELRLPVYMAKGTTSFGGWVVLKRTEHGTFEGRPLVAGEEEVTVADADRSSLTWVNSSATAAWDGVTEDGWSGFVQSLGVVGGYYSTVLNLQAYYLDNALYLVDLAETGLPDAAKGEDYDYIAYPGKIFDEESGAQHGLYLDLSVNSLAVDKASLVYVKDAKGKATKTIDWQKSVNPCKFTCSFKNKTGIFSGSFDVYVGDEEGKVQKKLGSYKHEGVMVLSRDLDSENVPSFADSAMSGYYLVPVKKTVNRNSVTWNMSYRLEVGAEEVERPSEGW